MRGMSCFTRILPARLAADPSAQSPLGLRAAALRQPLAALALTLLVATVPTVPLAQPAPAASAPNAAGSAPKTPAAPKAPTIKRWVDERGIVHFSDAPPPPSARPASPLTELATARPLSPAEQANARELLAQYRNQLTQPPADPPSAPASGAALPTTRPPVTNAANQSCAAQWQRYGEAYRCLDGFRAGKGIFHPEAFARCPVLKEPNCPAPTSP